jgi:hypothetical protein
MLTHGGHLATYAIGDIQGCFDTLTRLLERIRFDARQDRILLVGDLVNRGPRSLDVLRWARAHERAVTTVLGNHDLHLISRLMGLSGPRRRDTLEEVAAAPVVGQLPAEDLLVGVVVAEGGDPGHVVGQREDSEALTQLVRGSFAQVGCKV